MPWRHRGDLKRFKQLTAGYALLIGYRTLVEIARSFKEARDLLPGRKLFVVGREIALNHDIEHEILEEELSLDLYKKLNYETLAMVNEERLLGFVPSGDAKLDLKRLERRTGEKIMLCGGAVTYERYLPLVSKVHLTLIEGVTLPTDGLISLLPKSMRILEVRTAVRTRTEPSCLSIKGRVPIGCEIEGDVTASYYEL